MRSCMRDASSTTQPRDSRASWSSLSPWRRCNSCANPAIVSNGSWRSCDATKANRSSSAFELTCQLSKTPLHLQAIGHVTGIDHDSLHVRIVDEVYGHHLEAVPRSVGGSDPRHDRAVMAGRSGHYIVEPLPNLGKVFGMHGVD